MSLKELMEPENTQPEKNRWTQRLQFVLDALMIVLLLVNLHLIVFDWLFELPAFRGWLASVAPELHSWYAARIHPRFFFIDLVFVSVFLTEFFLRWALAIKERVYHRWYFFPFIHFYDLLGSIPVGGFRFLRLLRIVSITWRLQRAGIIDLSNTAPARFISRYYSVFVEEISDKVALNILSGLQKEVQRGGPVTDRIVEDVILPKKEPLTEWISSRVEQVAARNYGRYDQDIRSYVQYRIDQALRENKELSRLDQIPVFGSLLRETLSSVVSDVVFHVVSGMLQDLASPANRRLVSEAADLFFEAILLREQPSEAGDLVSQTLVEALEVVREQIQVQQWKLRDLAETDEEFEELLRRELLTRVREKTQTG